MVELSTQYPNAMADGREFGDCSIEELIGVILQQVPEYSPAWHASLAIGHKLFWRGDRPDEWA